jgi:hypothetical protein
MMLSSRVFLPAIASGILTAMTVCTDVAALKIQTVFVIVMENHNGSQLKGSSSARHSPINNTLKQADTWLSWRRSLA